MATESARTPETRPAARLLDRRTLPERPNDLWPCIVVPKERIDEAVAALALGAPGSDGRRESLLAHPSSTGAGPGLAPGIDVVFGRLEPGESTLPRRHNSSEVTMCLGGTGTATIDGTQFPLSKWDVWVTPSMRAHTLANTGREPLYYLAYGNRALLQKLEVYYHELNPPATPAFGTAGLAHGTRTRDLAPAPFELGNTGGWLMPYEYIVDPDPIDSRPLHWRWDDVAPYLGLVREIATGYNGRPLQLLYNPATGRRNGTTPCYFATIAAFGPNWTGPAHRHSSAAINYIMAGSGWSRVDGVRHDWKAGDIMLSAPGWARHGHAARDDGAVILTIQDHPLQIAMEALVWQEDLKSGPVLTLGAQRGFDTNLAEFMPGR